MPKIVDPEQRRAAFVSATWQVIAEEGLNGATLKRVAAEAGCTTGALTHYFADREELLISALRQVHAAAGERMAVELAWPSPPLERLRAVLEEALPLDETRLREWKVWLAFWGASAGEPALQAENGRRYDEWRGLLSALVTPLTTEAEVATETCLLMSLIDGLGLRLALMAAPAAVQARAEVRAQLAVYLRRFEGRAS